MLLMLPTFVYSDDSYDSETGIVHIPNVRVGTDWYQADMMHQGDLIFKVTSAIPILPRSESADVFDLKTNVLYMPSVAVGNDRFKVELVHQGDLIFKVTSAIPYTSGVFLDSEVSGLTYTTTSGQSGTLESGVFKYLAGDEVTFYLGDLELTTLEASNVLSVLQDSNGTNLSAMLIALDQDQNPENGIQIIEEVAALFDESIGFVSEQVDTESSEFPALFKLLTGRDLAPQHIAYNHATNSLKLRLLKELDSSLYRHYTGNLNLDRLLMKFPNKAEVQASMNKNLFSRLNLYSYNHLALPDIKLQEAEIKNLFNEINRDHEIVNNAIEETALLASVFWAATEDISKGDTGVLNLAKDGSDEIIGSLKSAALDDVERKIPIVGAFAKRGLSMLDNCLPSLNESREDQLLRAGNCATEMTLQAVQTVNDSIAAVRFGFSTVELNHYIVLDKMLYAYYLASGNWQWVDLYYGYTPREDASSNVQMTERIEHIADKELSVENSVFNYVFKPTPNFNEGEDESDSEAVLHMFNVTVGDIATYSNDLQRRFGLEKGYDPIADIVKAGTVEITKLEIGDDGVLIACYQVANNVGRKLNVKYEFRLDGLPAILENTADYNVDGWGRKSDCEELKTGIEGEALYAVEFTAELSIEDSLIETYNFDRVVTRNFSNLDETIALSIKSHTPIIDHVESDYVLNPKQLTILAYVSDGNFEKPSNFNDNFTSKWHQITGKEPLMFLDNSQNENFAQIPLSDNIKGCYAFEYTLSSKATGSSVTDTLLVNMGDIGEQCGSAESAPESLSQCGIPWGGSINSGDYVDAYKNTIESSGSSCVSESRICDDGVLLGSYLASSCEVVAPSIVSYQTESTPKDSCTNYSDTGCEAVIEQGDSFTKSWSFNSISNVDFSEVVAVAVSAPYGINISNIVNTQIQNGVSTYSVKVTVPSSLASGTYNALYNLTNSNGDLHYENGSVAYFWYKFRVEEKNVSLPIITDLSPQTATTGMQQTFIVSGSNLPSTIAMSLSGANCGNPYSVSSSSARVDCTPASTGSRQFYVAPVSGQPAISGAESLFVDINDVNTPDLAISSFNLSSTSISVGDSIGINATVKNTGSGTAGSSTLRYYGSADSTITTSDTSFGTDSVGSLIANGTSNESFTKSFSSAGSLYIGVCVDTVAGESSTTNNCSAGIRLDINDVNTPDLAISSFNLSSTSISVGDSIGINATVKNTGSGTAGSSTLRYYGSADSTITTSDTSFGTDSVGSLIANGTSNESFTKSFSSAGSLYIGVCVDTVAGESSTTNNCSAGIRLDIIQ